MVNISITYLYLCASMWTMFLK